MSTETKPDQTDILALNESLTGQVAALTSERDAALAAKDATLAERNEARKGIEDREASLKRYTAEVLNLTLERDALAVKVRDLEAKEQDLEKRVAVRVAQAGIVGKPGKPADEPLAKPLTATERVLKAKGVKSLAELGAKVAAALVVFAWALVGAQAQTSGYVTKSDQDATNAVAIWPATTSASAVGKQIMLKHLDVTGDHADTKLQLLTGTVRTSATYSCATNGTILRVASTNGFGDGDVIVIQRGSGDLTTHFVEDIGTTNNLVLGAAAGTLVPAGSYVFRMGNTYTQAVGNATVRLTGDLLAGNARFPLMLRLYSSTNGTMQKINLATALYGAW